MMSKHYYDSNIRPKQNQMNLLLANVETLLSNLELFVEH